MQLKEGNFTITENDYCNLITGHCESGDMSSAVGLLDIMKENGLKPGLPSYSALMAGKKRERKISYGACIYMHAAPCEAYFMNNI